MAFLIIFSFAKKREHNSFFSFFGHFLILPLDFFLEIIFYFADVATLRRGSKAAFCIISKRTTMNWKEVPEETSWREECLFYEGDMCLQGVLRNTDVPFHPFLST